MDDVTWGALTLTLTLLGGLYTWFAFRSRGFVAGLRGVGITLLPVALLLTHSLRMVSRIGAAIADWVGDFALHPTTWVGLALAGVSVVCFVVAGVMADRGIGGSAKATAKTPKDDGGKQLPRAKAGRSQPVVDVDPEMAEIEAMLKKRGIS